MRPCADEIKHHSGRDNGVRPAHGGSGRDEIAGDTGDDFISDGNDGVKDVIDCGTGTVRADHVDELEDCETKAPR